MTNERLFLASEVNTLESLLASIPDDRIIDRMSLEARLASVKEELAALPQKSGDSKSEAD
jgi:hypothetical protein